MKWKTVAVVGLWIGLAGCSPVSSPGKSVYLLFDTSPPRHMEELTQARKLVQRTLVELGPGDSLAAASIDTGEFSEQNIIATIHFDERPGRANRQKRRFKAKMDQYVADFVQPTRYSDVTGGLVRAAEYLNAQDTEKKRLIILSDMNESLARGQVARDLDSPFAGIEVTALHAADNVASAYNERIALWRERVETAGGLWKEIDTSGDPPDIQP